MTESDEPQPRTARAPIDIRSAALTAIGALAIVFLLQVARQVLIPIVLAVLVAYMLSPIVARLQRIGIPRFIGAGLAVALLAGALGVAVWSIADDVLRLVEELPRAARQVRDTLQEQRRADESALQKVHEAAEELEKTATEAAPPRGTPTGVQRVQIVEPAFRATDYIWWGSMGLVGFAGQLMLILFLVYFLLAAGDLYKRKVVKAAERRLKGKKAAAHILDEINAHVERYLLMLLVTSLIVAAATAAALWWLGLREWLFWGIAAGVLNTIPYFGPLIVSSGLAVVGFLQFGDPTRALAVAAVALVITSLEGWVLTPALMGRAARMNPVAVFIGLLFWGWVWGPWGVVLAVPMLAILKSICDRIDDLKPIGELLGD